MRIIRILTTHKWIIVLSVAILLFTLILGKNHIREYAALWRVKMAMPAFSDRMYQFYVNSGYQTPQAYIAHGGGVGEFHYTNSAEAVSDSIQKGFLFIELDLLETSDGHIVAGHDWEKFREVYTPETQTHLPMSYEEVAALKKKEAKYHPLLAEDICEILRNNPQLILVTDKLNNFDLLLKEIPFPDRMIVECFSVGNYVNALRSGIQYPAYCIWGMKEYKKARDLHFPIVTMDANAFCGTKEGLALIQELHDAGTTIMLFYTQRTDDDSSPQFAEQHIGKTVSKVYTDIWSPSRYPSHE